MYIHHLPPHPFIPELLFFSLNIHYSAAHGGIFMKPAWMRNADAVTGEAFELDVCGH